MHIALTVLPGDPVRLGEALHFLEDEGRPAVDGEDGCLGMVVAENAELGVAVVESFWTSGDTLCRAERTLAPLRAEAARLAVATESVERFEVGALVRSVRPHPGAGVRLTRYETDPARVEDAVTAYGSTVAAGLRDSDGFCVGILCVDRLTGRSVGETVWRDTNALAASRSSAAVRRRDTVAASGSVVRAVEEYRLVFSSFPARQPGGAQAVEPSSAAPSSD